MSSYEGKAGLAIKSYVLGAEYYKNQFARIGESEWDYEAIDLTRVRGARAEILGIKAAGKAADIRKVQKKRAGVAHELDDMASAYEAATSDEEKLLGFYQ